MSNEVFLSLYRTLQGCCAVAVGEALSSLGGLDGVLQQKLFISGYEEIARQLASAPPPSGFEALLADLEPILSQDPNAYYFYWALADSLAARGDPIEGIVRLAPASFQPHLMREFC